MLEIAIVALPSWFIGFMCGVGTAASFAWGMWQAVQRAGMAYTPHL